jgi:hypothetical protein
MDFFVLNAHKYCPEGVRKVDLGVVFQRQHKIDDMIDKSANLVSE